MHSNAPAPTKEERQRMATIKRRGCIACLLTHFRYRPSEVHHVVEGRKRLGHLYTVGLCAWHHRAIADDGMDFDQMREIFGPSLADEPGRFRNQYGAEKALIAMQDVVNALPAERSYLAARWYREPKRFAASVSQGEKV